MQEAGVALWVQGKGLVSVWPCTAEQLQLVRHR